MDVLSYQYICPCIACHLTWLSIIHTFELVEDTIQPNGDDCLLMFITTELEITNLAGDCRTRVTVHAVQLMPQKPYRAHESHATLSLDPEQKDSMIFPVVVSSHNCLYSRCLWSLIIGWTYTGSVSDSVLV